MRNLQEQVKKAFCYQKLFWPFIVWINCSSDLKNFANSRPSASNFKSFSWSLEHFFLTVGQNNFRNKIPWQSEFYTKACGLNIQIYCGFSSCITMDSNPLWSRIWNWQTNDFRIEIEKIECITTKYWCYLIKYLAELWKIYRI